MVTTVVGVLATLVSLSARRAWIEILTFCSASFAVVGRSPQGERG